MNGEASASTKNITRRFRAKLNESPQLEATRRTAKRARRASLVTIVYYSLVILLAGPAVFVGIPLVLTQGLYNKGGISLLLATTGYATTIAAFAFAEALLILLYRSRFVTVHSHLPASDAYVAPAVWNTVVVNSLLAVWFLLIVFACIAWNEQLNLAGWLLALSIVLLLFGFTIAAGTWLALSFPRARHGSVAIALGLAAILYQLAQAPHLPAVSAFILALLPASWPGTALWLGFINGIGIAWLVLVPPIVAVACLPRLLKRLARDYAVKEFSFDRGEEARAVLAGNLANSETKRLVPNGGVAGQSPPSTAADSASRIQSNGLNATDWTSQGWHEQFVARWLTPRQRTIVGFLTGDAPQWSLYWGLLAQMILIVMVLQFVVPRFGAFAFQGAVVWSLFLIGLGGMDCPGLRMTNCGGSYVTQYANFPLSTREISAAMFKVGFIRSLLISALFVPFFFTASAFHTSCLIVISIVVIMSVIAWQVGARLSIGLTLPRLHWSNAWMCIPPVLLLLGSLVGAVAAPVGIAQHSIIWMIGGCLTCTACSFSAWWFFKWLVDSGRIDLVAARLSLIQQALQSFEKSSQRYREQLRRSQNLSNQNRILHWFRRCLYLN